MENHLVIMARAPRLGMGKRRLARDIGALAAHKFYVRSTGGLLRRLGECPKWRLWLAVTPDKAARSKSGLWDFRGRTIAQGQGDLGDRMGRLFKILPPGPAVIIGSDLPDIKSAQIVAAFRTLGHRDWVMGPALDGGYWLIGARRRPSLRLPFAQVRWSSAHTLADTLVGMGGQTVGYLETLDDVDDGASWRRWRDRR
ncbi:MAG: TIGR04282 family arsenosugar biosynthesis glycosyltransferase [Pseudomonadota bacterium]